MPVKPGMTAEGTGGGVRRGGSAWGFGVEARRWRDARAWPDATADDDEMHGQRRTRRTVMVRCPVNAWHDSGRKPPGMTEDGRRKTEDGNSGRNERPGHYVVLRCNGRN